ncbi:MAG: DUF4347 domain-containing protein, partial [Magnetococcales bacterium]|nr:DUF4347 domain-containing protein [Magnetococcales bacterium]
MRSLLAQCFSLEPRMMFDGAATDALVAHMADNAHHEAFQPDAERIDTRTLQTAPVVPAPVEIRPADPLLNQGKREVAFIDTSVTNYQTLVDGVRAGVEVVLIDGTQSGLAQMAQWAETHSGYDAIHILSHGTEATLRLGRDVLTSASLQTTAVRADLAVLGHSLTESGDLLLYGCDVASGVAGQAFIDQLAQVTGADVGASADLTGATSQRGNWVLEKSSGTLETQVVLPSDMNSSYDELLAVSKLLNIKGNSTTSDSFTLYAQAVDSSGNLYVYGANVGNVTIGGTLYTSASTGTFSPRMLLIKYDSSLAVQWVKQVYGPTSSGFISNAMIQVDQTGNCYVSGRFTGFVSDDGVNTNDMMYFEDTSHAFTQGHDFLIKLNTSGTFQWMNQWDGGSLLVNGSRLDPAGGIVMAGTSTSASITVTGQNATSQSASQGGAGTAWIWATKFNTDGSVAWTKRLAENGYNGLNGSSFTNGYIYVDRSSNLYLSGIGNALNFGQDDNGTTVYVGQSSQYDTTNRMNEAFAVKYTSTGTPIWAHHLGLASNTYTTPNIFVDISGNVYLSGGFNYVTVNSVPEAGAARNRDFDVTHDNGTADILAAGATGSSINPFVLKLNSSGAFQWVKAVDSTITTDGRSRGVVADANGNVYVLGRYAASLAVGGGSYSVTSNGGSDIFVWKLNASGTSQWLHSLGGAGSDEATNQALQLLSDGNIRIGVRVRGSSVDVDPYGTPATVYAASTGNAANALALFVWDSDGKLIYSNAGDADSIPTPSGPTVSLSVNNASIAEAAGTATITATLSATATTDTTVTIAPTGTATGSGTDYTLSSTTITILAGQTTGTATITAVQDNFDEEDETVIIDITAVSGGDNATEDGTQQTTVTLTDDDAAPTLAIDSPSITEGNSGTSSMTFNVALSAASSKTVTVQYATSNGTATAGSDYASASGTLTFAPGEVLKTFNVTISGDTTSESTETFTATLSNPGNATLATASGTGTIVSDELSISSATYDASTGIITVNGTGFTAKANAADVDVSKLRFFYASSSGQTLDSTYDVEIVDSFHFTITLTGYERGYFDYLFVKNGTQSIDNYLYGIAADDDWMTAVTAGDTSISEADRKSLTVSNNSDLYVKALGTTVYSEGIPTAYDATQPTLGNPMPLFGFVLVRDPGDSWNNGSLTVQISANSEATDTIYLPTTNADPANNAYCWIDGTDLKFGAVTFGSVTTPSVTGATPWTFTFNGNATNQLVQQLAAEILYTNPSSTPSVANRTLTITATDADGDTNTSSSFLRVLPSDTLGGSATSGNLKVVVSGGLTSVFRYNGTTWINQKYGNDVWQSTGSLLYTDSGVYALLPHYSNEVAMGGAYTAPSVIAPLVSQTADADSVTTTWTAGSMTVTQEVTLANITDSYIRYNWTVTNNSGAPVNDLRLFQYADSYLDGVDAGPGFWSADTNTVGVTRISGDSTIRIALMGVTTPSRYDSEFFANIFNRISGPDPRLTDTIDATNVDNGYAMEWDNNTLNAGSSWEVIAFETFSSGSVLASGGNSATFDGTSSQVAFTVGNYGTIQDISYSVSAPAGWTVTLDKTSDSNVAQNGTKTVTATVTGTGASTSGRYEVILTATGADGSFSRAIDFITVSSSPPTLTTIDTLINGAEDTDFTITYADLAAAADEADSDHQPITFRIEAVSSGTLKKGGIDVTAGTTTLAAGESLVWTPAANANGSAVQAFTVKAYNGTAYSSTAVAVKVALAAVNDDPTLTGIPTDVSYTEDTSDNLDLSAVTLADVDSTTENITFTVTAAAGTLTATSGGNVTISGSTSNTLTLTGKVADIDTYLNTASNIRYQPATNQYGDDATTIALKANDGGHTGTGGGTDVSFGTIHVDIAAIADTPNITNTSTTPGTQSASGLVITRHAADGAEVTHFRITNITGGTLYLNDGTTVINNDDFITFAAGNAGLKFTPSGAGGNSFDLQASTSSTSAGLGGSTVTATISVGASVANPTINEDTDSGAIAITRGGAETYYKITGITGGALYSDAGYTTAITDGSFIANAGATTNVYFRPTANNFGPGGFSVQAASSNSDPGLTGSTISSAITITPIADTPTVTNTTTNEDTQSSTGLVIGRNTVDSTEVTHFKITTISGGTLYKNNGITQISNNDYITFAEAQAGLKFTPTANSSTAGSFRIYGATSSSGDGLSTTYATATITVTAIADTPTVATPTIDEDSDSGAIAITRNAADGAEMTHYKITGITGGTLYSDSGYTTAITNGGFIASAGNTTNVYFRPAPNRNSTTGGNASFTIQASTSNADGGLGGSTATSTITLNAIADTPNITNASTTPGTQSSSGLVITRHAADGAEVTHFRITNITGG